MDSLQNFYLACRSSEKLVQLARIITHEVSEHQSSQFIVYFATCACVDYFYQVSVAGILGGLHSSLEHLDPS
jgi:ATP-dependent RNA helicase DDX55/SPB4